MKLEQYLNKARDYKKMHSASDAYDFLRIYDINQLSKFDINKAVTEVAKIFCMSQQLDEIILWLDNKH